MRCPFCNYADSKVIDSRASEEGNTVRRRRECLSCQKRFTTYERVEEIPLVVVKKNESREAFNREKLINGLLKACEKRPISMGTIEKIADIVERELRNRIEQEVSSQMIGELVMRNLREVDEVAYVRFASVYREFKDLEIFMQELQVLLGKSKENKVEVDG